MTTHLRVPFRFALAEAKVPEVQDKEEEQDGARDGKPSALHRLLRNVLALRPRQRRSGEGVNDAHDKEVRLDELNTQRVSHLVPIPEREREKERVCVWVRARVCVWKRVSERAKA